MSLPLMQFGGAQGIYLRIWGTVLGSGTLCTSYFGRLGGYPRCSPRGLQKSLKMIQNGAHSPKIEPRPPPDPSLGRLGNLFRLGIPQDPPQIAPLNPPRSPLGTILGWFSGRFSGIQSNPGAPWGFPARLWTGPEADFRSRVKPSITDVISSEFFRPLLALFSQSRKRVKGLRYYKYNNFDASGDFDAKYFWHAI